MINEILTKSKESIERVLSANDIDKNNDGCVDAISFFLEGNNVREDKVEWSDLLWSHKISGMNLSVKFYSISDYYTHLSCKLTFLVDYNLLLLT